MKLKKLPLLLLILSLLFVSCASAAETPAQTAPDRFICDEADVLDAADEQRLEELARKVYELTDTVVGFVSLNESSEEGVMPTAKEYYAAHFDAENCLLLTNDVVKGRFVLFSCGPVRELLAADDAAAFNAITDAYADETDYVKGIETYLYDSYTLLTGFDLQDALDFQPVDRTLPLVVDKAGILTAYQQETLQQTAESISDRYQCEVAVVFVTTLDGISAQTYADDFYDYNGYGYGENDDGILLLIATDDREYAMTTCGTAIAVFDDDRLYDMEENFLWRLSAGDWVAAGKVFLQDADSYLSQGPYVEPDIPPMPLWAVVFFLPIGFLLAGIPMKRLKKQLVSVRKSTQAADYSSSIRFHHSSDQLINTKTSRIRRSHETSSRSGSSRSSSSHRSTTHHSSSGRSHGGRSGRF